jgi:hypothetical protein
MASDPYGGLSEDQFDQLCDAWFAMHPEACLNPSVPEMIKDLERGRSDPQPEMGD